ncbi:hypothetical protein [Streptomyces cadmiisoli]|uniref:hypothetical protein n=1 Tax=Streptomyces cadmiisoli TaxID=2184053 RepID=UPI003D72E262
MVLADPGGNEFYVLKPGNGCLAGCGFIGALACDDCRAVDYLRYEDHLGWGRRSCRTRAKTFTWTSRRTMISRPI